MANDECNFEPVTDILELTEEDSDVFKVKIIFNKQEKIMEEIVGCLKTTFSKCKPRIFNSQESRRATAPSGKLKKTLNDIRYLQDKGETLKLEKIEAK